MLMEMFMKENGITIKLMEKVFIFIVMGHLIPENGQPIRRMDME